MSTITTIFNGPISGAGSAYLGGITTNGIQLVYTTTGPSGANLVLTLQEADPINPAIPLVGGRSVSTGSITTAVTSSIELDFFASTAVLVSWTMSGTFSNVNLTLVAFTSDAVVGTGSTSVPATGIVTVQGNPDGVPIPVTGSLASNESVGPTGATAPAFATEIGLVDNSGNLQGVSSSNPLPITGSISASNPSVGTNSSTAPTSSTQIGFESGSNLVQVSASNPLPITGSISASNPSVSPTGSSVPADATMIGGKNGSGNLTAISTDSSGNIGVNVENSPAVTVTSGTLIVTQGTATNLNAAVVGIGTAGTPSGGILTVQGSSSGEPIPVSGSITATNPSVGATGSTVPADATLMGGKNGSGNLTAIVTDSSGNIGVNVENSPAVTITSGSVTVSGSVTANQGTPNTLANAWGVEVTDGTNVLGTSSHPIRTDPTGATTQPISGNVTNTVSVAATTSSLSTALINVSATGNNTLIAGSGSTTIRVFKMFLVFGGTTNATFYNGASTPLTGAMPFNSGGNIVLDLDSIPWFLTSAGNGFVLNLSAGVSVDGLIYFTQS